MVGMGALNTAPRLCVTCHGTVDELALTAVVVGIPPASKARR